MGLRLPEDYKQLVERFPRGEFQSYVQVNHPGDYDSSAAEFLGFYAWILEDMRGYRAAGDGTYPYPIFPEAGGLLPWAHGRRREPLFWLTQADDPNAWPVVVSDYDFLEWRTFEGKASEFLVDVVEGRFDGRLFGVDFAAHGPRFEPIVEDGLDSSAGTERSFWSGRGQAANEFAALAEVVGPAPGTAHPVVWPIIHDFMGVQMPSDYRSFIDTYGSGTFGDIKIAVPGGPDVFDLYLLLARAIEAARAPDAIRSAPIYPEPDGMIAWGEAPDDWCFSWAPSDPDPERWGVVFYQPRGLQSHLPNVSFSRFLRLYSEGDDDIVALLDRPTSAMPPRFAPYRP